MRTRSLVTPVARQNAQHSRPSSHPWCGSEGKFGPLKQQGFGMFLTRCLGRCLPSLTPKLILASDPSEVPTWMDKVAVEGRAVRYDRSVTTTRGKPNYAGYVGTCLLTQASLEFTFLGRPYGCFGLGKVDCCASPPLAIPAVLATTPTNIGDEGIDEVLPAGVDQHIDVQRVRALFPQYYGGSAASESLVLPNGTHENMQASFESLFLIFDAIERVMRGAAETEAVSA